MISLLLSVLAASNIRFIYSFDKVIGGVLASLMLLIRSAMSFHPMLFRNDFTTMMFIPKVSLDAPSSLNVRGKLQYRQLSILARANPDKTNKPHKCGN
jgi:hypothetical protein